MKKKQSLLKLNKQCIASLTEANRLFGGAPNPTNNTNWSCRVGKCNTGTTTDDTTTNGTGINCVTEFAECESNFGEDSEILCNQIG